ncbi:hypothetical protein SAMN02910315_00622 [Methanobrevibacter millerae]|uniref:Uncharacterized protein n=1 Tax=Methanobrevibacter millerae TaxID=230361 RepID=A0A1G5VHU3_9EURY|nr:hypothetical protein SAMN02910315_00622 [Methanobrevibacter millerae]
MNLNRGANRGNYCTLSISRLPAVCESKPAAYAPTVTPFKSYKRFFYIKTRGDFKNGHEKTICFNDGHSGSVLLS